MNSRDQVELAIMSAVMAHSVLEFTRPLSKNNCKLLFRNVIEKMQLLEKKVDALPED